MSDTKKIHKDRLCPSVHGVGFIGIGKHSSRDNGKVSKSYATWKGMLARCYYPKYQEIYPTYKGCTVHISWHNFQVFAEWFDMNYIKGYHLDKDIKLEGNKVYNSEYCSFVSAKENVAKAHAKHYKITSPAGELFEVYNLNQFCLVNNLDQGHMSKVVSGKRKHHKKWRLSL